MRTAVCPRMNEKHAAAHCRKIHSQDALCFISQITHEERETNEFSCEVGCTTHLCVGLLLVGFGGLVVAEPRMGDWFLKVH